MDRLTNDDPQGNTESILNLFYVRDREVWVRGGGDAPGYPDISLNDFIRQITKKHNLEIATDNPDVIPWEMEELLADGTDTLEGVVATLYNVAWAFAELRERLAAYEDTGLTPEEAKKAKAVMDSITGKLGATQNVWCDCGDALGFEVDNDGDLAIGCFGCDEYIKVSELLKLAKAALEEENP